MAERKPYTTKTRQIILEYLKSQKAVTVSVADIEKYLKTEGIKVNTTTVYRYLDKLCDGAFARPSRCSRRLRFPL